MLRNLFLFLSLAAFLFACRGENPDVQNATPVGEREWKTTESGRNRDALQANSVPEADLKGLASFSLQTLQKAYKAAAGKVPGVGEVTVSVDDNLNLLIENKSGSGTVTTQANLRSLDPDFAHLEIIVNQQANEFPGFRMKVLPGQPKVVVLKNGSKSEELDYLEVILAERSDVESTISALTLAVEAAQEKLPEKGSAMKK